MLFSIQAELVSVTVTVTANDCQCHSGRLPSPVDFCWFLCLLSDKGPSHCCELIPHCKFDLHFSVLHGGGFFFTCWPSI